MATAAAATTAVPAGGAAGGGVAPELPPPDLAAARALLQTFGPRVHNQATRVMVRIAGLTDYTYVAVVGMPQYYNPQHPLTIVRLTDTLFTIASNNFSTWLTLRHSADVQATAVMQTDLCFTAANPNAAAAAAEGQPKQCALLPHVVPGRRDVYRFEDVRSGGYLALLRLAAGPYRRREEAAAGPRRSAREGVDDTLTHGVWVLVRPGERIAANATLEFQVGVPGAAPAAGSVSVFDSAHAGHMASFDWDIILTALTAARTAAAREAAAAAATAAAAAAERRRTAEQARAAQAAAIAAACAAAVRVVTPADVAAGHDALTAMLTRLTAAGAVVTRLSLLHAAAGEADLLAVMTAPFATLASRLAVAQRAHARWRDERAAALAAAAAAGGGRRADGGSGNAGAGGGGGGGVAQEGETFAPALARFGNASQDAEGALSRLCDALHHLLALRAAGPASDPRPTDWPALCRLLRWPPPPTPRT